MNNNGLIEYKECFISKIKMIFKKIFGKSEVHYNYSNNEPINNVKKEFVQNDNINVNIKSQNTIIERNYFLKK